MHTYTYILYATYTDCFFLWLILNSGLRAGYYILTNITLSMISSDDRSVCVYMCVRVCM